MRIVIALPRRLAEEEGRRVAHAARRRRLGRVMHLGQRVPAGGGLSKSGARQNVIHALEVGERKGTWGARIAGLRQSDVASCGRNRDVHPAAPRAHIRHGVGTPVPTRGIRHDLWLHRCAEFEL
jgi:hypothetical protein